MNIPIFIVACISLLAVMAHTFIGTKETALIAPQKINEDIDRKLIFHWMQSMCAFHMLTIDLLIMTVALFTISLTDIIPFDHQLALFLSGVFFLWGIVWLVQLFILKAKTSTCLKKES